MIKTCIFGCVIGGEIVQLVKQTGAVAQVVLLILLIFSILSWSIILSKSATLKRARTQSARFLRAFRRAQRLRDISAVSDQFTPSPLLPVFDNAYDELNRHREPHIHTVQCALHLAGSQSLTRLARRF